MKLRFKVDQAEALRQGVDAPTSVVTIEINPKTLTQEERNLLADRTDGIDVRQLRYSAGEEKPYVTTGHITANLGNYEALMAAVRANEAQCQRQLEEQARERRALQHTEHEFNELDLEMVMDEPFRDFLQSIGCRDKVRHCVDGRYMVTLFTVTCTYNIQYAPPPNNLLAVVRQLHDKSVPDLNLGGEKIILWVTEQARTSFDEAIRQILLSELELGDLGVRYHVVGRN